MLIIDQDLDTSEKNRVDAANRKDLSEMVGLLDKQLAPMQRAKRIILRESRKELTVEHIHKTIREMKVGEKDSLVCFFSGHGASTSKGHFLALPGRERLFRSELLVALQAQKAKLTVVLTDSCANLIREPITTAYIPPVPSTVLVSLLLKHRGVVDINSSSPGESSRANDAEGGYFTSSFVKECKYGDSVKEEFVSWQSIFERVQERTNHRYKMSLKNNPSKQPEQRPYAYTPLSEVRPDKDESSLIPYRPATVVVKLPESARLVIEGDPTQQAGSVRRFSSPPLRPGQRYTYTLQATLQRNGKQVTESRTVRVSSGMEAEVDFEDMVTAREVKAPPATTVARTQ
jgi:uncharacterized protein (TIGR03000 family)